MDLDKDVQSIAGTAEGQSPDEGGGGPLLHDAVQTLSRMIRDLEKQLERMLEINEALDRDLDGQKKKTVKTEQERARLGEQVRRMEQELATLEDLRAEIGHLGQERTRLAATIEEAGRQVAEAEHENRKLERLTERIQAERDDAFEEVQSLEAQFDHAMEMVADLKTRVATFAEERDALAGRLKVIETQLQAAEQQRDSLKTEVDESRRALDEIRRQVADACVTSQRYYYQQLDDKE